MNVCVSNPPYNIKWEPPLFAQMQNRFYFGIPPKANANYAFILTALEKAEKVAILLPNQVLTTEQAEEKELRCQLVKNNLIEAVISCPRNMFESTDISTCILVLNKNKKTAFVEMIDMRNRYEVETREQKGQFGGNSHEKRTYQKSVNILTDAIIDEALQAIKNLCNINGYCKAVTIESIKSENWTLLPSRYIEFEENEIKHRTYAEIIADLNNVIKEKNCCKLTINETLAKRYGIDLMERECFDDEFQSVIEKHAGQRIEKNNCLRTTKSLELKFENTSKDVISNLFIMMFSQWKQHIHYLNTKENIYLSELRDALLPDLMSGKIYLEEMELNKRDATNEL